MEQARWETNIPNRFQMYGGPVLSVKTFQDNLDFNCIISFSNQLCFIINLFYLIFKFDF